MKNQEYLKETYEWKDLLAIVHKLRQPDGCPWDSTQTYESMKNVWPMKPQRLWKP